MTSSHQSATTAYAAAGVDVEAGERAVALMRASVHKAHRSEVVGDFGGFAGLFDISRFTSMERPILATSTDGVGTKIAIARALDIHHTIGRDLVAMVLDDLVVCGAEPLFMTDYIATGSVIPERIADIVRGIADGCAEANCALVGGETAEHPGLMAPDEYDVAGAGTGIVDGTKLLGPERVQPGDVLIAMASSGLHSNGYSLARHVLLGDNGLGLDTHVAELGRTLGEELLEPTRIYVKPCLELINTCEVHAFSHITGGGLAANIARVLPPHLAADLYRDSWRPLPIFTLIGQHGNVDRADLERTFNMGIGMIAIVAAGDSERAITSLELAGVSAWVCGEVRNRVSDERGDAEAKGGSGGAANVLGDYK
ncbi:MAG: putative phosphoribosylformylglycinamidine cyclo-ligase [Actinomycetota bacterium]|jgi:phosphoribosylformylglycinamidine cyclo-ligase